MFASRFYFASHKLVYCLATSAFLNLCTFVLERGLSLSHMIHAEVHFYVCEAPWMSVQ